MTGYDYKSIENLLSRLLGLLSDVFRESEKSEVDGFVDAGEYGLALETLVDIIFEERHSITVESSELIYELTDLMQMDRKDFQEKLNNSVDIG